MITFLLVIVTLFFIACTFAYADDYNMPGTIVSLAIATSTGWYALHRFNLPPTPEEQQEEQRREAAIEAQKVPVLFAEKDGCQVYKFKDNGYNHYFTRCQNSVTTDASRYVTHGKTGSTVIETIKTN